MSTLLRDMARRGALVCEGCGEAIPRTKKAPARTPRWCSDRCRKNTLYGGTCSNCGGPTSYSGRAGVTSDLCAPCARLRVGSIGWRKDHVHKQAVIPEEALLAALREFEAEMGGPVSVARYAPWAKGRLPTAATIINRLGSWCEACARAGVEHGKVTRAPKDWEMFSDEDVHDALARCARASGRPPTRAEYDEWREANPGVPSSSAITARWKREYKMGWVELVAGIEAR